MIRLRLPLIEDEELLDEMETWCESSCDIKHFYFFPQHELIGEPARVWFAHKEDAFAFQFKYTATEDEIHGLEENCNT